MNHTPAALADMSLRLMAALCTFAAMQPDWTGVAGLALISCAAGVTLSNKPNWAGAVGIVGAVALCAISIQLGASTVLVMAGLVMLMAQPTALTLGAPTPPWLRGWIVALATTQMPSAVRVALNFSDSGPAWFGAVAMPILFVAAALANSTASLVQAALATLFIGLAAYTGIALEWDPRVIAASTALPAAVCVLVAPGSAVGSVAKNILVLALGVTTTLWTLLPTLGAPGPLAIWIPETKTAISRYFDNYEPLMQVSGFRNSSRVTEATQLVPGTWVMLPSAAHPKFGEQLEELRKLSYYDTLRIIVAGEHTDADGVATALNASGSPVGLNNDTTIPPGNRDLLGWSSGIGAVPSRSITFNRGASLKLEDSRAVPITWVQGGHRELDRLDDGRLGDMIFRPGERVGLYCVVAMGREPRGATWLVLGDSTPLLNEYLASGPAELAQLLALGTGIPSALGVIAWVILFAIATRGRKATVTRQRAVESHVIIAAICLPAAAGQILASTFRDVSSSRIEIVDRAPFGDRAVGRAVVALSPALLESDVSIEIGRISGDQAQRRVSVGHPDGWTLRLDCSRAGNVSIGPVRMLDVVTCPEASRGTILGVGEDSVAYRRGTHIVVLDQHFISNVAPEANIDWLKQRLSELAR